MHTLLLAPTDVLFFRDGRPMGGSLAGHSAAWPLPTVANAALHAAFWRAGFDKMVHAHRRARSGQFFSDDREKHGERFGSLVTGGPFPVLKTGADDPPMWFFPRPLDAASPKSVQVTLAPTSPTSGAFSSTSNNHGLTFAVGSSLLPTKDKIPNWWSETAWNAYLQSGFGKLPDINFQLDSDFADIEAQIGIGINSGTGAQDGRSIYSAHYLRLRERCQLGLFAKAEDKDFPLYRTNEGRGDLVRGLFDGGSQHIIIGGQQRICSATLSTATGSRLPLPQGKHHNFATGQIDGQTVHFVKWILLSPAIWPEIGKGVSARGTEVRHHPGGWLPNWIDPASHEVLLRSVSIDERRERRRDNYNGRGYDSTRNTGNISAQLVAAVVPKPIPITGWTLGDERFGDDAKSGAKPTHLAVPAGSVYYFACKKAEDAHSLASALNWHGDTTGTTLKNRRSTLLGEKGFGLGVCGTWQFHGKSDT